jgi:ArsR family transcriptional regulator, arsenate/arsenite/antimonite-responsive transcriptional repressor
MKVNENEPHKRTQISRWLKALAEPRRLEIMRLILAGVPCNCELGDRLGIAPNLISYHLRVLQQAGLIRTERDSIDARWVYFTPRVEALSEMREALGWLLQPELVEGKENEAVICSPAGAPQTSNPSGDR